MEIELPSHWGRARRALARAAVSQFHQPRGPAGRLAGRVMAHRSSNRRRNRWVAAVLDLRPGDRVLEIGFGPGIAVAEMSRRVGPSGHVHGLDHSAVMLRQATRRNAAAVRAGQVTLTLGAVERLPDAVAGPYDAVLAVNSLGFWPEPAERLAEIRRRIAPGGRIALVTQPRVPGGATRDTTLDAARSLTDLLVATGFTGARTEVLDLDPPVACVLATNPPPAPPEREPGDRDQE